MEEIPLSLVPLVYGIFNSSEEKINHLYYCQSPQLCISENNEFHLIKLSVMTTVGVQSRWYVEFNPQERHDFVIREIITRNESEKRKRLYGAIEISSTPLITKPWKRLSYLQNDSIVAIEDPTLIFTAFTPSCNSTDISTIEKIVEVSFLYHQLLLSQYLFATSPTLSSHQQTIIIEGKKRLHLCLKRSNHVLPEHITNEKDHRLYTRKELSFRYFLKCYQLLFDHAMISFQKCDQQYLSGRTLLELLQEAISVKDRLITDKSVADHDLLLLQKIILFRVFYQLFYLKKVENANFEILKILSMIETSDQWRSDDNDFDDQLPNLKRDLRNTFGSFLFIIDLIIGNLYLWKLDMQSHFLTVKRLVHFKETDFPCILRLDKVFSHLQQLQAFYEVYGIKSNSLFEENLSNLPSGDIFHDILQKFEFILSKLGKIANDLESRSSLTSSSFSSFDPNPEQLKHSLVTKMNNEFEQFLDLEYRSFYTSTLLMHYVTIGMNEIAYQYYFQQFIITDRNVALAARKDSRERLHSNQIKEFSSSNCLFVLQTFFPNYDLTDISCIFNCNQLELLITRSELVSISYELFLLLHNFPSNIATTSFAAGVFDVSSILLLLQHIPLFNQYLLLLSQTANPVILSSLDPANSEEVNGSVISWLDEVIVLRLFFHQILFTINAVCEDLRNVTTSTLFRRLYLSEEVFDKASAAYQFYCNQFTEETVTIIVRGLFLEAYQGLNLFIQFYQKYIQTAWKKLQLERMDICISSFMKDGLIVKIHDSATATEFLKLTGISSKGSLNDIHRSPFAPERPKERPHAKELHHFQRIKVGMLSNSFSRHSVGRLFAQIIAYLAVTHRDQFEVYLFSSRKHTSSVISSSSSRSDDHNFDDVTQFLESIISADHWIDISSLCAFGRKENAIAIGRIVDLELDVMIYTDLLMQSTQYLFAYSYRFARNQVLFWGHPYTSSNPFIDYYITSSSFEANHPLFFRNSEFTEQLIFFDSLSFQLFPPESTTSVVTEKLSPSQERRDFVESVLQSAYTVEGSRYLTLFMADSDNKRTILEYFLDHLLRRNDTSFEDLKAFNNIHIYGALQSLMKMHPLFDQAIVELLIADPIAVILLLRNQKQYYWQRTWQSRLAKTAESYGIRLEQLQHRVFWINAMKHGKYADTICSLDVVLDPFPFGGGVTMCDAIAGPCKGRRKKEANRQFSLKSEKFADYSPVPFVAMKNLQSIHAIGAGIGERVRNAELVRIIDDDEDTVNEVIRTSEELLKPFLQGNQSKPLFVQEIFRKYLDQLIWRYVGQAIELAIISVRRFELIELDVHRSGEESANEDPYHVIYDDQSPLIEWKDFITRISE